MIWLKHYLFTKALRAIYLQKIDTLDINTYIKYLDGAPSNSGQILKNLLNKVGSKNLITFNGNPLTLEWSTPRTRRKRRRLESNSVFALSSRGLLPSFASIVKWLWGDYFLFLLKSWLTNDFRESKSWSIYANSLNNGSEKGSK